MFHRYAFEGKGFRSAIYHGRCLAFVGITFSELEKIFAKVSVERCGRFDFSWNEFSPCMFDQINFNAIGIAIEIDVGAFACIIRLLHPFKNDKVLEKAAAERVVRQLFYSVDSRQCASKSRVEEIDLGRFDETFASILVPRRQKKADIRGMENRKPFCYGLSRDAAIVCERCNIKNGTNSANDKLEECRKNHRILNFRSWLTSRST